MLTVTLFLFCLILLNLLLWRSTDRIGARGGDNVTLFGKCIAQCATHCEFKSRLARPLFVAEKKERSKMERKMRKWRDGRESEGLYAYLYNFYVFKGEGVLKHVWYCGSDTQNKNLRVHLLCNIHPYTEVICTAIFPFRWFHGSIPKEVKLSYLLFLFV